MLTKEQLVERWKDESGEALSVEELEEFAKENKIDYEYDDPLSLINACLTFCGENLEIYVKDESN